MAGHIGSVILNWLYIRTSYYYYPCVLPTDKAGSMMSIGAASDVPLKITETDITQLKASITPPSGGEEPCTLKRLPNGNIGESSRWNCIENHCQQ